MNPYQTASWTIPRSLDAPITLTMRDVRHPMYPAQLASEFKTDSWLFRVMSPAYVFPNDLTEQERLALQGPIIKSLFDDRLYFAPLSKADPPQFILDIATGVGDWAVEMGDMFPQSRVVGTDLSPIQPAMVPPNVEFYVEDS